MLKQNTTKESLLRWVLENVQFVSSFLLIVVESKEKNYLQYIFFSAVEK